MSIPNKLPKEFLNKHLPDADTSLFMGKKFSELSKEDLMAVAIAGWKAEKRVLDQARKDMETLFGMPKK